MAPEGSGKLYSLTKTARLYVCTVAIGLSVLDVATGESRLVDEELVATGKIDIRPEYPVEAQVQRLTGTGVFILHIDVKNGRVSSIDVEKSTGHKILDDAALNAFRNLQFARHTAARVKIPVTFVMPPPSDESRITRGYPVTAAFQYQRPSGPSHGGGFGRR